MKSAFQFDALGPSPDLDLSTDKRESKGDSKSCPHLPD